jgi:hypothetical protein
MFNLETEVAAWSRSVYAERCKPAASEAELIDHLYCEIDRARATGLSDEAAFRAATTRLGSTSELTAEIDKNRSAFGAACQVMAKLEDPVRRDQRGLMVAHAIVWAALIIATSLVLKRSGASEVDDWLVITVFIPLWLVSDLILRQALRRRPASRV